MTVYVVAQLSIHDRSRYDRYAAQFMSVLAPFDGTLLAADESPVVVEGGWDGDKIVLLEFPDRGAYAAWAESPEYVEIAKDRMAATTGSVVLFSGIGRPAPAPAATTERCDECGFVYDEAQAAQAGATITAVMPELSALLVDASRDVRARPAPTTWSPLEYACHVRDVLLVQRERLLLALREDRPSFVQMGRDERVEHDGYAVQDPERVARQLDDAAVLFANVLDRLSPAEWDRTAIYNYPQPTVRTLRWIAVHTVHEVEHHLLDMQR
jgi:uncharacterized protein (DUF1330 family)